MDGWSEIPFNGPVSLHNAKKAGVTSIVPFKKRGCHSSHVIRVLNVWARTSVRVNASLKHIPNKKNSREARGRIESANALQGLRAETQGILKRLCEKCRGGSTSVSVNASLKHIPKLLKFTRGERED